jgi:hypothetical protein
MRCGWGAVVAIALLWGAAACSSQTPAPTPSQQPTTPQEPTISCGTLSAADCGSAEAAVLDVARGRKWSVTKVEMGKGTFCELPGRLFSGGLCPDTEPPGSRIVGHALVSTDAAQGQAYFNLYSDAKGVLARFITLATPPPSP